MDQLKLCMSKLEQVKVRITSDRNMLSHGFCSEVSIYMQEMLFHIDFYVLELNDSNLILRAEWLSQLGSIWWNFNKLEMRFNGKGQPVTLKVLENNKTSLISEKLTWKMMVKGEAMLLLDMAEGDAKLQKICGSKQQKEELN